MYTLQVSLAELKEGGIWGWERGYRVFSESHNQSLGTVFVQGLLRTLVKMQIRVQLIWGRARESAFLKLRV